MNDEQSGTPSSLVELAVERLPNAIRQNAQKVIYLTAAGWGTQEIGHEMGLTWRKVNALRDQVGDSLIQVLVEEEGYSRADAIRYLRIPENLVDAALVDRPLPPPPSANGRAIEVEICTCSHLRRQHNPATPNRCTRCRCGSYTPRAGRHST